MSALIWGGAAVALGGVAVLAWCIREAMAIRRADLAEDEARRRLNRLVAYNMAAVGTAFLGLALMLAGVLL